MFQELTKSIVTVTTSLTHDPVIIDHAHLIKLIFDKLNATFSKVHNAISHSKHINKDSLGDIQTAINSYMTYYRANFPLKTIPKQHILEHHCITFITKFPFGLGLLGEQGTECSHQAISKLETRANGIPNQIEKLRFILKSHLLQISPRLLEKYNKSS